MVRQIDKKIYHIAFLIGLTALIAVCIGWLWGRFEHLPRLFVSDIDLGSYKSGDTLERAIRLKNEGSGELLIHDVKTCCGISLLGDFPRRIPAGSTDVIVLRIRTPGGPLPYEGSIALQTNDSREPVKVVFVRGTPDVVIFVSPPSIDLKHIIAGEQVTKAAIIMIPDNKQVIFNLVSSSPNIQVSSPRGIPTSRINGREYGMYVMDVAVDKETPRGPLQEYILLKTGITEKPYVVIPTEGMVERGIRARPEQVFFGLVSGDSIVNRTIRLEVIGPGWDTIKVKPPDCPAIAAELKQKDENKFELHVSLDPAKMPEQIKSYMTLQGSSGDVLQLPVLGNRKIEHK